MNTVHSKIKYYSGCITFGSIFLSALTQCLAIGPGNLFLINALLFGIVYACCIPSELKERISRCRGWLLSFLVLIGCFLLTCFFSPEMGYSFNAFFHSFLYRASPFLLIILLFPQPKYVFTILIISIFSCFIDCIGGIANGAYSGWRIKGLFGSVMTLAGFLCVAIPFIFCYLFDFKQKWWKYLIWAGLLIFFIVALVYSGTRGAWLATLVSLLLIGGYYSSKNKKNLLLFLVICAAVACYVGTSDRYVARLKSVTSTTLPSNTERLAMWNVATKMIKDHPITGVGFKRFSKEYQNKYTSPKQRIHRFGHPHSNVFYVLADSGIIGFSGFVFFFGFILLVSFVRARKTGNVYYLLIFATTLAIQLQGLTEYNFGNQAVIKYYWLFLGCYLALAQNGIRNLPLSEESSDDLKQLKFE